MHTNTAQQTLFYLLISGDILGLDLMVGETVSVQLIYILSHPNCGSWVFWLWKRNQNYVLRASRIVAVVFSTSAAAAVATVFSNLFAKS